MTQARFTWIPPTGPFPVGVVDVDLSDDTRAAMYAAPPETRRCLTVTCWYPAQATVGHRRRSYLKPDEVKEGVHTYFTLSQVPVDIQQALAAIETASFMGVPPANGQWPLVVFCHGAGSFRNRAND